MRFLFGLLVLVIPVLAVGGLLQMTRKDSALPPRSPRDGEVHPWEAAADRAERRRVNALIEEELTGRAA